MTSRQPKACRYCGHVAADHIREERNWGGLYACRDVDACGNRIRQTEESRREREQHAQTYTDLPF